MSKRPVEFLLDDILVAIGRIEQYIKDLSFDAFSKDQNPLTQLSGILRLSARLRIVCRMTSRRNIGM